MPRHGGHHGGGHGGHHGGGHHYHGTHRGRGRGPGGWYGWPYPYPAAVEYVEGESDLDRKLKEMELLERMKRLQSLPSGVKATSGFDMPSMPTLLIGAAFVGGLYLLMRKR